MRSIVYSLVKDHCYKEKYTIPQQDCKPKVEEIKTLVLHPKHNRDRLGYFSINISKINSGILPHLQNTASRKSKFLHPNHKRGLPPPLVCLSHSKVQALVTPRKRQEYIATRLRGKSRRTDFRNFVNWHWTRELRSVQESDRPRSVK